MARWFALYAIRRLKAAAFRDMRAGEILHGQSLALEFERKTDSNHCGF
jgi:hypothetical protein